MDSRRSRLCWDQHGGSRPHLPLFDPQLPRALWERFQKDHPHSIIFHAFFSDVRHQILVIKVNPISMEFPENPLAFDGLYPPIITAVPSSKKTDKPTLNGTMGGSWLHLAVTQADLPLAHECIRLGTPIEHKDRRGYSALYFACSVVSNFFRPNGAVAVLINLPPGRTRRKDLANDLKGESTPEIRISGRKVF
ncbi:hypothetical protein C8R47DRAFT_1079747 [Mycena vitilis]|nr:hypothetical protein C8R47DRAFT_1079747 [Mycena vitilis]